MRIRSATAAFNDQPFTGRGASLYATIGATVIYRNLRILPSGRRRRNRSGWIKGSGAIRGFGSGVDKTARRASSAYPTATINWTLPAAFKPSTTVFDVRHYRDHVEHESDNFRTASVSISAGGNGTSAINATADYLSQEARQGGIVRIRLRVHETIDGVQPILVRAMRTAGPTSPADVTTAYTAGQTFVEIDTPALSDSAPYTYTIQLENGSTTKAVITGLSLTADATGPPAAKFAAAAAR